MADGGLRPAEPLGRPRDAQFSHEDLEHDQKVEVEAAKIERGVIDFIHEI
jgi:hypothetical protein